MHIEPLKFLENSVFNTKFDVDGRLRPRSTGLNSDNNAKIEEFIAANEDDSDEKKDFRKKNR